VGEVRRTGIFVEPAMEMNQAPLGATSGGARLLTSRGEGEILINDGSRGRSPHRRFRPNGAENYFGLGFYKYAAPAGAGERGLQPASTCEWTRALEILCAGGSVAVKRRERRAPWGVADGKDPVKGSLGWTNGPKGD